VNAGGVKAIEIKHKIWLEKDGRVIFGQGRRELLQAVDECKSLSAAAKKLQMSYRAAWGRLKASEDRMGIKLVDHSRGKNMNLTPRAKELLDRYDRIEREIESLIETARIDFQHITEDL